MALEEAVFENERVLVFQLVLRNFELIMTLYRREEKQNPNFGGD